MSAKIADAIAIVAALAVIGGAGMTGWQLKASRCAQEKAVAEKSAALRVVQEYERIQDENQAIEQAWINTQKAIEARHEHIRAELPATMPAHQKMDGPCALSPDAVRLLNRAAGHPEPMPEAAAEPSPAAQAPAPVTELDLAETCRAWAEQYELTAGQLNALIDWHERMSETHD